MIIFDKARLLTRGLASFRARVAERKVDQLKQARAKGCSNVGLRHCLNELRSLASKTRTAPTMCDGKDTNLFTNQSVVAPVLIGVFGYAVSTVMRTEALHAELY